MAKLAPMPPINISQDELALFGNTWTSRGGSLSRTPPQSSGELGRLFDMAVGMALAQMLGGVPIVSPNSNALTPPQPDCVEVGAVRIIGGVRPQNFDAGYRPDGVRFAFDSKTLNDKKSIGKNWQNMINDLATEATTVHSRFPHALVALHCGLSETMRFINSSDGNDSNARTSCAPCRSRRPGLHGRSNFVRSMES